jgi:anhydro-N-acetylmuramic acid kinase
MEAIKILRALGLKSTNSLEGVAVSLVETDGVDVYKVSHNEVYPYEDSLSDKLRKILGKIGETDEEKAKIREVELELTEFHVQLVKEFQDYHKIDLDVIGFHGHTTYHNPAEQITMQIGDAGILATETKTKVVSRFAKADIFAGGQGAPLYPIYHQALCAKMEKPLAIVNIGGISSITFLGSNGEMIAFDAGPGNAVINDWTFKKADQHMDYNGKYAITGTVNEKIVNSLMRHKYFAKYPPKALDRNTFKEKMENLEGLSLEDGAATVTAFVSESIAYSISFYLPEQPREVILCGGGANNPTLKRFIRRRLNETEVTSGKEYGWDVSTIEAQAIAYLAVRRLYNMPSTFPSTTGALQPIVCGNLYEPE